MDLLKTSAIDYGVAHFTLPGQEECGDQHLVSSNNNTLLLAVVDGIGHGKEAATAAKLATSILAKAHVSPLPSLVYTCHEKLRVTRGVALSAASVNLECGLMTWLGIGNVQGVVLRAVSKSESGAYRQLLLLRGGIVGIQMPPLQPALIPVHTGDTLIFATDGIRTDFSDHLNPLESPQKAADRILRQFRSGSDDALVFVARFTGVR